MPRTVIYSAQTAEIADEKTGKSEGYLALVKFLRDDAGNLERVKGGVWLKRTDRAAIAAVLTEARAFVHLCEVTLAAADAAPKSAPKASRAPKNPPPAPVAPVTAPAVKPAAEQAKALEAQIAAQTGARRASAVATARANKPAPVPARVDPVAEAEADWLAFLDSAK